MGHRPMELHGEMSKLNATDKTFALRGVTVWYGGLVEYRGGTETTRAEARDMARRPHPYEYVLSFDP